MERFSAMWLIQLFIGIFLTASALIFLTGYTDTGSEIARGIGKMFGKNSTLALVVAIFELISGILLLANLFIGSGPKWMYFALIVVFIFWAINIISVYFVDGFLKPGFMVWLRDISLHLVVLSGLWGVMMGARD